MNISNKKNRILVIFGATGDLTKRKLLSSLYNLYLNKDENSNFVILGAASSKKSDEEYRKFVRDSLEEFDNFKNIDEKFLENIFYNSIDFTDVQGYEYLKERLEKLNSNAEIIYYLALPPTLFSTVLSHMQTQKLNLGDVKIVFEKPFGSNLGEAKKLNKNLLEVFDEKQVYRIDHYLGKDAVQNFLVLRFANTLFEPMWNSKYIDNIQITAFEELGVEQRAGYYEKSGALRDMLQNHLFQMLSLIAMEPPVTLDANAIRNEKVKIFSSMKINEEDVVFGQYSKGKIENKEVCAYKEEPGVNPNSRTETFVALKTQIENWRWKGVDFYLRTGKRMKRKGTEIIVEFKHVPSILYNKNCNLKSNKLLIKIQPEAEIKVQFNIKSPCDGEDVHPIFAEFEHEKFFEINTPEAYQFLFKEIFDGDQTLFARFDGVEASWAIVDELLQCKDNCPILQEYESGSNGPKQSEELIKKDNREWYND